MGIVSDLLGVSNKHGIDLDGDDIAALEQLSQSEDDVGINDPSSVNLDVTGTATGAIEMYVDSELLAQKVKPTSDGLMWEPIIRTGTWAMRPGPRGQKKRVPLQVVSGRASDARKQIGLQDIIDAFEDEAIQHVTVPLSHDNKLEENQGFIDKLKVVKAKVKNQSTKKLEEVSVLMGGYRITEPDTKGKMERGTYANRSAGLIYDYTDTERGKTWKVVLEHVAITNRPWITGMAAFGRKIAGVGEALSLSLEALSDPTEDEYLVLLSEVADDPELVLLADEVIWDPTGSPEWAQAKINQQLSQKRSERVRAAVLEGVTDTYEAVPNFRCTDVQDSKALISQGYSDDAPMWVAGFSIDKGKVTLDDVEDWAKARKAVVEDADREDDITPLSEPETDPTYSPEASLTGIELAQYQRKQRGKTATNPSSQEETMTKISAEEFSQLSPAVQKVLRDAEANEAKAIAERDQFSTKFSRLQGTVQRNDVDNYITHLKSVGFTEEKGFGGLLIKARDLMLADDGEPAIQSDKFSDNFEGGELTATDVIKELFSAFEKGEDGKVKLGEQLAQPAEGEGETDLDEAGKPKTASSSGAPGKPKDGPDAPEDDTKLSDDEILEREIAKNPELARVQGLSVPKATA